MGRQNKSTFEDAIAEAEAVRLDRERMYGEERKARIREAIMGKRIVDIEFDDRSWFTVTFDDGTRLTYDGCFDALPRVAQ